MKIYKNNLININNKFKKRISYLSLITIKLGIITRFYYLSIIGYILYLTLNSNDNYLLYLYKVITKKNKPYFILLKKTGFNKDAEIINKALINIDSIRFSRTFVKGIASCFLSKDICDNNYFSASTIHDESKKNLYKFYDFLFAKLPTRLKPLAIFTGNFGYAPEQELFNAAYNNKIKGIAIQKENLKTKGLYDLFKYLYSVRRSVFGGELCLVYNEVEAELERISKVIDVNKTRIEIIGCPRIDEAHNLRKNISYLPKHKVLFFGFGSKTALPAIPRKSYKRPEPHYEYLNRDDKNLSWHNLLNELCNAYYYSAKQNPNTEYILKLKESYSNNNEMISFFRNKKTLNNLKIITKGDSISLLANTSILISFTSTALFEGIARGIPVIMPSFGECKLDKYKPFFFDFSNLDPEIMTAYSQEDLKITIKDLILKEPFVNKNLSENKKMILQKWVGNSDRKSCERLISILEKEFS